MSTTPTIPTDATATQIGAVMLDLVDRMIVDLNNVRARLAELQAGKAIPIELVELDRRVRELSNSAKTSRANGEGAVICPLCGASSNNVRNLRRHLKRQHDQQIRAANWRGGVR